MPAWKLITNHGAVLILLAQHGRITVRELAHRLGLTERLIHRIIAELAAEGYVSKQRVGRGNQYQLARPRRPGTRVAGQRRSGKADDHPDSQGG
jgi:predicted ArsR family transcriptional regulator